MSRYDYQFRASRYTKGLTYLKNRAVTNQKHKINAQNPKEHKHKVNHQTTKRKRKKKNQLENKV